MICTLTLVFVNKHGFFLDGLLCNWQIGVPIYLGMFYFSISAAISAIRQVGLCMHFSMPKGLIIPQCFSKNCKGDMYVNTVFF